MRLQGNPLSSRNALILKHIVIQGKRVPIIFREIWGKSYKQAKIYMGKKKKLNGSRILRQQILLVQRLWVLNTRFKSIQQRRKPLWKGPNLITKIHSHRRADLTASTSKFQCIIDKHQHISYLLLLYNAAKEWLILKEQITLGVDSVLNSTERNQSNIDAFTSTTFIRDFIIKKNEAEFKNAHSTGDLQGLNANWIPCTLFLTFHYKKIYFTDQVWGWDPSSTAVRLLFMTKFRCRFMRKFGSIFLIWQTCKAQTETKHMSIVGKSRDTWMHACNSTKNKT
ncbi:unnamed protein product [Malus baccata var. baccata]